MNYIDLTLDNGSGVSNYNQLTNQPQINGVTLTGDKSSTDLGIFLPDGYTVTVATDDSGDFTNIQDALNSLNGKVCAGTVTINVSAGTYNIGTTALALPNCVCTSLVINGHSKADTVISCDWSTKTWTGVLNISNATSYNLYLQNINFTNMGTKQSGTLCLQLIKCVSILSNLAFDNFSICYRCYSGGQTHIAGSNTITNCTTSIFVNQGVVDVTYGTRFDCTNVTTLIAMEDGGFVSLNGCQYSGTVTNLTSQTIGAATKNGLICGTITSV